MTIELKSLWWHCEGCYMECLVNMQLGSEFLFRRECLKDPDTLVTWHQIELTKKGEAKIKELLRKGK